VRLHREDEGNVKEEEREREREREGGGRQRHTVAGRCGKCVSEEKKIDRRSEEGEEVKDGAEVENETTGRRAGGRLREKL